MTVLPLSSADTRRVAQRSDEDWLHVLLARLLAQRERVAVPEAYYDGDHPLQFATSKFKEAFGSLFGAFADNWCQIVVDAPVERLRIVGFRTGTDTLDKEAWAIWQDNAMDIESTIAHTEAGKCGTAYLLVDPSDGDPRITVEHASQVIVATDPGDRRSRLAALKQWVGDDGYQHATLYLPDRLLKYESELVIAGTRPTDWTLVETVDNPLGVVPVVTLSNSPGLLNGGRSDLDPAIPLQNAINKLSTDMIVASEFGAFRQRVLTGVEIPRDPETGRPLGRSEIVAAMSRLWTFESPDAKVSDLAATDLANFVTAIANFRQDLAAQTRTPPHYLLGQVVNASGDALKVAEAGLVSKCDRKILNFSDPWEETVALTLLARGHGDIKRGDIESLWESPERTSLAELVDAAVKKRALDIPLEALWLELGYSPQKIDEMLHQRGFPARPAPGAPPAGSPVDGSTPPPPADGQLPPPAAPAAPIPPK